MMVLRLWRETGSLHCLNCHGPLRWSSEGRWQHGDERRCFPVPGWPPPLEMDDDDREAAAAMAREVGMELVTW